MAKCPGCSGEGVLTDDAQVLRCQSCGGVFTADSAQPITMEQAMKFVVFQLPMSANAGPDGQFYFDLDIATEWKGQAVTKRIHGWADSKTRAIVQFG